MNSTTPHVEIDTADGITIPAALAWSILIAAVTAALAITASALGMTDSVVIIATGLAVVAGCSILATVVILCCRGAIKALSRELRSATADNAERLTEVQTEIAEIRREATDLLRAITESAAHLDRRIDDLVKLAKRASRELRTDHADQLDRTRAHLTREMGSIRAHQSALVAEAMATRNQPQRRHLNSVE